MNKVLIESIKPDFAKLETFNANDGKDLFMKGIFIQGGIKNANQRVYPINEISRAITNLSEQIRTHGGILGEVDHPTNLRINLDRVSHMITEMWLDGPNGFGKMKILPTPMGNLVRTMLESGVKLGVSSRGSGNVNERDGAVSDFDIVTVDIVAQPSAPNAYPTAVYEGLMNFKGGHRVLDMAKELKEDQRVQKYLQQEVRKFIAELKL